MSSKENLKKVLETLNIDKERIENEYDEIKKMIIELLKENDVDYMTCTEITIDNLTYEIYGCPVFYMINRIVDNKTKTELTEFDITFSLSEQEEKQIKQYRERNRLCFETNANARTIKHIPAKEVKVQEALLDD